MVFALVCITLCPFLFCNHMAFIVFWMSYFCKCPVALSHGAVGWSAVCDCSIL